MYRINAWKAVTVILMAVFLAILLIRFLPAVAAAPAGVPGMATLSSPPLSAGGDATLALLSTEVSGPITADTTWTLAGSPYLVTGNVLVMEGVTLTIESGVEVRFNAGIALQIDGELIAQGTSGSPITFTSNAGTSPGAWAYILFTDSSVDATYDGGGNYLSGSIIQYAVIEYAGGASLSDNGALRIDDSSPFVDHTTIRHSASNGIRAFNNGAPRMTYNTITDNAERGISVNSNGTIEINHNTISNNNGGGIYNYGFYGTVTISDNTITGNSEGIYIFRSTTTISDNTITGNNGRGINIEAHGVGVMISGNIITGNNGGGIYTWYGTVTISDNTITGNSAPSGGGIDATQAAVTVSDNTIIGNTASGNGGGIHIFDGGIGGGTISRNTITGNTASGNGGGIDADGETISHNIIANNSASSSGGGINSGGTVSNNSILRNTAGNNAAVGYNGDGDFSSNTILDNVATGSGDLRAVYIEGHPTFNSNNIYGNTGYALYNGNAQGSANLNATNNWWGTTNDTDIQALICDWFDDSNLGIVDYSPYLTSHDTNAPISPPTGLSATVGSPINLSWSANPESDLAGYKVYYDTDSGFPYDGTGANEGGSPIDVGNVTSFTLTGLTPGTTYYLAITAYDNDADDVDDWFDGNESWFSEEVIACVPYLRIRVNQSHDWVDACCGTPGATVWVTVTDSLGGLKGTAQATTGGDGCASADEFSWWDDRPDITVGDRVDAVSSDGIEATATVIPITGQVDAEADTLSGQVLGVPYPATMRGEIWEEGAPSPETQTDDQGYFTLDFSPFDIQPRMDVAAWYIQPDGNWVGAVFWLPAPELSISKWNTPGYARPGGVVVYGIEYRNDGDGTAENTLIVDTLPPSTAWAGDTSGVVPDIGAGGVITWNLGDLDPGDESAFMVTLDVFGLSDGDTIDQNCVVITTTTPGDYDLGNNDSCAGPVDVWDDDVEIGVDKYVNPHDPTPGQEFNYNVNVCNNRGAAAGPLWLTDTLPLYTTLVSWSPQNSWEAYWTEVVTTGGELVLYAPGMSGDTCADFNLFLLLDAGAPVSTTLENTVVITTAGDVDPDNNQCVHTAHVSPPRYDMRLDKRVHQNVPVPGGWIEYFFDYTNDGNIATHIWITDTMPNGLSYEYAHWGGGQPGENEPLPDPTIIGNQLIWDLGVVPVGGGRWFHVQMNITDTLSAGDVITNCAIVGIDGDEDTPEDNTSCYPVTLNPNGPNLRVTKQHDWHGDGQLGYEVRFENIGDETVSDVWITDTLPISTTWDGWWDMDFDWERLVVFDSVAGQLSVSAPEPLSPTLQNMAFASANFGGVLPPGDTYTFTFVAAEVISPTNFEGCNPWPVGTFTGKAALISRGTCQFGTKVLNAETAGADFVIVHNHATGGDDLVTMAPGDDGDQVTIPSVFVGHTDGQGMVSWYQTYGDASETTISLYDTDVLRWQFSDLYPGDYGWLYFNANLDEPGVRMRWYTNTVETDMPPGEITPGDNICTDVAFSGGEVDWVDLDVGGTRIWGCAYSTPITITSAHAQMVIDWDNCWDEEFAEPFQPGDVVTIEAGAALHPVVIQIPDPFTAYASSITDTVWGQIDALDHEMVEVDLWGFPTQHVQTDGSGNYSATFPDVPRGAQGDVNYYTEIDYADVGFHRRFQTPDLIMNVNYAHEWVNGNYEAGHTVWITVTEGDGFMVKATAELTTGPIPEWGGQSGFNTHGEDWSPSHPDIQPGDWVYGLVNSSSYTTTVHVGTINGEVNVDADIVSGTIHANWFTQMLNANCGVWEENGPGCDFTVDPDGGSYFCDFGAMGWDLLPGQNVGVQYQEPDGDWVINSFFVPYEPFVRVNQSHEWVDGQTPYPDTDVWLAVRDASGSLKGVSQTTSDGDAWFGAINVYDEHGNTVDIVPGDTAEVRMEGESPISVPVIPMSGGVDADADTVSGNIPAVPTNSTVRVEVWEDDGPPGQETLTDEFGDYFVDFSPFDLQSGHTVGIWYVNPDGNQVGIVRHALRLEVRTAHDEVEGDTWANVPVTVTVNGGETETTTSDAEGRFWTEFTTDITATDVVEAWAGTGTQYASLDVEPVSAHVDDAEDKVWGYGPPDARLEVEVEGDWQETFTDGSGYYEVYYDWDIGPWNHVHVEYPYPDGHETCYDFGPSDVGVAKWARPWDVVPGDEFSYFVRYWNWSDAPASDVVITDTLPYPVTYQWDSSGTTPTLDPETNTLVWHLGALAAHRDRTFELRVQMDENAPLWNDFQNWVEISDPDDSDPEDNWDEEWVHTEEPSVDVGIDKWLDEGRAFAGAELTYVLEYYNDGSRTAHDVVITDTLPTDTAFVTTDFEVGVDGISEWVDEPAGLVVWDIGTLAPGESRDFQLTVRVLDEVPTGTLLVNRAEISTSDDDTWVGNDWDVDTQVVEPYAPDLWVEKWVESDVSSLDDDVTYRIEYHNDGPADAHSVVLTDTLPLSMTHVSHSAWTTATVAADQVIWKLGTVAAGHGGYLYLTTQIEQPVPVGTVFTNTVDISTTDVETDYLNNHYVDVLGPPRVICVPWIGPLPHRLWSGLTTTLKGTAKGYGLTTYEWDPGDGSPVIPGTVGDPYVIEASHVYSAPVGTVYTATLTVWGAFGWSDTDTYTVRVFNPTHGVEVDVAIDEGLWYIHKAANRYSSAGLPFAEWQTGGYGVAETASAVQAFQVQGHRPGGDLWEDPYVENVQRGWNALFTYSNLNAMTVQPAGNPDGDGDGVGIGIYDDYGSSIYESGLAMMALATTGSPGRVAHTGPPVYVRGQTYASIAQDMADWFAWGQNDDWSGWARGGWRYQPNSGDSDNSNTQFPVLGLAAAEHTWGITVPPWVKDELRDYWLAYTQNPVSGGFGYTDPDGWVNVGKTGAGIMALAWTGVPVTDTRVISAAQFIEAHWHDVPDGNWNGNVGEMYAMYAVKKGSQLAGIHHYGLHFWRYAYSSHLVGVQWPDGSFDDDGNFDGWQPMSTSWAVMILSPGLYRPLPAPIVAPIHYGGIGAEWGDGEVLFDASDSHHTDPDRAITLFEWDFGDGSPVETTPGPITTHTYLARDAYLATLTVVDDAGVSATTATLVNITAPDYPPVADPDGPYVGSVGAPLTLDGSASYDPDEWMGDAVVLYEWDISGGSIHTTTEPTLVYTWTITGTFPITLRVRDRGVDYGLDSPRWSEPVTTTVTIGEATISEVKVTNVRDTSFTVSWITNVDADGEVHYGTDPANTSLRLGSVQATGLSTSLDQTAYDDRGAGTSDDTHYVTLEGLLPDTTYYFDVVSGLTTDDNDGAHYTVTTGPTLGLPGSDTIYGQVFKEDGTTLAEGTIVYITLRDADGSGSPDEAAPLSALVDGTGYWSANLGNARLADLSGYFDYSASGDQVRLEAQGAADGTGCLLVDTADDSPAEDLILNVSTCLVEAEIPLQIGWNHISLPLDPVTSYTAEGVCTEINDQGGDVAEIDRWYASGWAGHICGLPFNDFDVELGSDYFIRSNAVITWTIEGYEVTTPVPLDLQIGWNSIGIPHTDAYTAQSLCDEINAQCGDGTAVEVDRWYASGWDGHICGLSFNDFDVEIGKGYFVKSASACTVTPSLAATSIGRWRMENGERRMENGERRMENGERTMDDLPPSILPLPPSVLPLPPSITGVKVSNVRDTSFTVSWGTDVIATGWVNYGTSPALGQTAYDDRGAKAIGQSHHVTLQGLSPQTTYYFEVVSGATVDDHKGSGYQVTTGPTLDLPTSHSIYGQVFESDGVTPAEGAIVYVTLRDVDGAGSSGEAEAMSALVDSDGYWYTNLGNARLADGSGYFTYSVAGDAVTLVAQGVDGGLVSRTVDTSDLGLAAPLTLVRQRRPYLPLVAKE